VTVLRSPSWWIRRLAAMSPPEIAHRLIRTARHPLDRVALRLGLAPPRRDLAGWQGPDRAVPEDELADAVECADRICGGERPVLGLGWLALGDAPWHREPLAGGEWPLVDATLVRSRAPGNFDPRLTWEINRGHEWIVLAHASIRTGEPRYRERLAAELASWRRNNPIGIGINWLSSMEAAIRIHSLCEVATLFAGSDLEHIGTMIHDHAWFVARNLSGFSSANNHLIVELSALVVAGRMLGDPWHVAARRQLEEELARQVHADGVNAEMATHYHMFVMEAVLLAARAERASGWPSAALETRLRLMADYLAALTCTSGELLGQGDSDDGLLLPPFRDVRRLLAAVERLVGPSQRRLESRAFADAGQIVLRSAGLVASFDAGAFGFGSLAAHAHCDALAVNIALGDRPFLVDRGTYVYNGDDEARDAYRLTSAHNTLQIEGREQGVPAGPFLWRRVPAVRIEQCDLAGALETATAIHDGFAPARHRRTLLHRRGVLVIVDEIIDEQIEGIVRFHFAPELEVLLEGPRRLVAQRAGVSAGRLWCSQPLQLVRTRHSPAYRAMVNAPTAMAVTTDRCVVTAISASTEPRGELRYIAEHATNVVGNARDQLRRLAE
jgi:hypothetical protein